MKLKVAKPDKFLSALFLVIFIVFFFRKDESRQQILSIFKLNKKQEGM